jgi:polysaccharide biosynthesis transport protein
MVEGLWGQPARSDRYEPVGDPDSSEFGSDAHELFAMFRRRKWLFAGITFTGMSLATLLLVMTTPLFTAESIVLVSTRHAQVVDLEPVLSNSAPNPFLLQSQLESEIEMIRSYPLASNVIDRLNLMEDPEINPMRQPPGGIDVNPLSWAGRALGWLRDTANSMSNPNKADAEHDRLVMTAAGDAELGERAIVTANFLDRLSTTVRGRSTAISIAYTSADPVKAAAVADAVAKGYVQSTIETKSQATRDAARWLEERIAEMRNKVANLDSEIERYRQEVGLVQDVDVNMHAQRLGQINNLLIQAEVDAAVAQDRLSRIQRARGGNLSADSEIIASPLIQNLRAQEAELQRKQSELQSDFGPKHPQVLSNQASLSGLRAKIDGEIARMQQARESDVAGARQRVQLLKSQIGGLEQETGRRNLAQIKLRELVVEGNAQRALYETFLRRQQEISQQLDIQQADAQMISPATPPAKPSYPRASLFLSCSLVISMIMGAMVVVVLGLLKKGFKSVEEIEQALRAPALAIVPRVSRLRRYSGSPEHYLIGQPLSLYAEAIRGLRTSVRILTPNTQSRTVLFTSSLPHEGKTAIALSFARMSARAGERVVIVDCDLRRPRIHEVLGDNEIGLTDLVQQRTSTYEAIQVDDLSGLNFITHGSDTDNPAELLEQPQFRSLLQELSNRYDLVVLDSPPVLSVSDARLLARMSDSTVYVVEWDRTSRREARLGFNMILQTGAGIAGVVLSKADPHASARYGYAKFTKEATVGKLLQRA